MAPNPGGMLDTDTTVNSGNCLPQVCKVLFIILIEIAFKGELQPTDDHSK